MGYFIDSLLNSKYQKIEEKKKTDRKKKKSHWLLPYQFSTDRSGGGGVHGFSIRRSNHLLHGMTGHLLISKMLFLMISCH